MRLGIFGGTFDPIHYGHLLLAESCREALLLERVLFLPAAVSPLKQDTPPAGTQQRLQMVRLAIGGHEPFVVSSFEIDRGGVSYTVDTLQAVRQEHPHDELFFLLGADALESLAQWYQPAEICQLAQLVPVNRGHQSAVKPEQLTPPLTPETVSQILAHQVSMPAIELASTDIRQRVAQGMSIRYRVPPAVEAYIRAEGLYRSS